MLIPWESIIDWLYSIYLTYINTIVNTVWVGMNCFKQNFGEKDLPPMFWGS